MLLMSDRGFGDAEVAGAFGVDKTTVWRLRKRVAERGFESVLAKRHREKLDEKQRAYLIDLSRSEPPVGHRRWTLKLLAGTLVEQGVAEDISHVTVWKILRCSATDRGEIT